jgi:23S rRNA pseudouridine955/2504/2580 synthase
MKRGGRSGGGRKDRDSKRGADPRPGLRGKPPSRGPGGKAPPRGRATHSAFKTYGDEERPEASGRTKPSRPRSDTQRPVKAGRGRDRAAFKARGEGDREADRRAACAGRPFGKAPPRFVPEPPPPPEPKPVPTFASTGVQNVVVSPDEDGMRVDRFIEARFPGLSFSHIQRVVRKGEVRVSGKRVDP